MFFEFSCVCKENAAVIVVACFHHDFCAPVIVCTGYCVSPMDSESGEAVKGVTECWAVAIMGFLDDLCFLVVCLVGEFEFC